MPANLGHDSREDETKSVVSLSSRKQQHNPDKSTSELGEKIRVNSLLGTTHLHTIQPAVLADGNNGKGQTGSSSKLLFHWLYHHEPAEVELHVVSFAMHNLSLIHI